MKTKDDFKITKRNTIFSNLTKYCPLSDEHDYIEVTEWSNGEGVDVNIYAKPTEQAFHLTWGQFDLLKKIMKKIDKL